MAGLMIGFSGRREERAGGGFEAIPARDVEDT
jgi:hypothetical protein